MKERTAESYIASAKEVLKIEADAVLALQTEINENFVAICELLRDCRGRVVVTGMGKSGHVGNKIAATLASTGTPAFFVHPAEASHGDLGMLTELDVVLALSNSGETDEILSILPIIARRQIPLVSMTGNANSTLAKAANYHLLVAVKREACPLNLAPTASTTAALAMGDAIAVTLLEMRGFTSEDFAFSHPGGKLGRRLLLRVRDIMAPFEDLAAVAETASLTDTLLAMTQKPLGVSVAVDTDQQLLGVFTEGDLRRSLMTGKDVHELTMADCMTKMPFTIQPDALAVDAVHLMETKRITALPVVENGKVLGVINMHHLLQARVI